MGAAEVIVAAAIDRDPGPFGRSVTARVRLVFKGSASAIISVRIGPETSGVTSVDYRASPGEHVLYLRRVAGAYETNDCSGSHAGSPSAEESRLLGPGGAPSPATFADEFAASGVLPFAVGVIALAVLVAGVTVRLIRREGRRA